MQVLKGLIENYFKQRCRCSLQVIFSQFKAFPRSIEELFKIYNFLRKQKLVYKIFYEIIFIIIRKTVMALTECVVNEIVLDHR